MSLNALEIYLTKSRKIIVPGDGKQQSSSAAVATFNRNLISLGFVCSQELTGALAGLSEDALGGLYQQVVPILKKMTGAHRASSRCTRTSRSKSWKHRTWSCT
jgi:hypothetical protein